MEENIIKKPTRRLIKELEIGDTRSFPIARTPSIRATCTLVNLQTGMRFSTSVDRDAQIVTVKRIA